VIDCVSRFLRCRVSLLLVAAIAVVSAISAWAQQARPVVVLDRIVAVVNDEVITRAELDGRVKLAVKQLAHQGTPPPPLPELERQILERLVNDRVLSQMAKSTGLRVDDPDLDRAIVRIAENNKLTVEQLRKTLEQDGVQFSAFREDIRTEMILARLREREVDSKIVVTAAEIDNAISLQESQQGRLNEYNLAHILVTVPESASPEQIRSRRARAEEAHEKLKAGGDFRQAAAAYSDSPEALQGGVLGWRQEAQLPTLFVNVLRKMQIGELSEVLRSPNGFHILKINDKRGADKPVMVQQTRVRHILIKTNELVSENEARARLVGIKERLENNADFASLARANSEDASAAKGGELGWISPGDTVPEFERAMNALKPGEISPPVKTPFGWHLIQLFERRTEDMSKERQRLGARQALRERKSEEAYQEWVRQIRDRASIELRLEEG
jgi:peptidyl-prolyl cis-trans isomerase SurA